MTPRDHSIAGSLRAFPGRLGCRLALFLALCLGWSGLARAESDWEPIPPEDLAAQDSAAAPGTDLEFLFVRTILDGNHTKHHVRAKIYNSKGLERIGVLAVDHGANGELSELRARVVKPNGSMTELTPGDFREAVLWRAGDTVSKRTTFAFPGLSPGDVVEYRWNQGASHIYWGTYRVFCQAENVFTREYTLTVRSAERGYTMVWENCPDVEREAKGKKLVIRNLPPFVREPHMPAEGEVRGSITLIFIDPWRIEKRLGTEWPDVGPERAAQFDRETSPHRTVRTQAAELTTGMATPREAVARLYRFVQTEITNLDFNTSAEFAAARKRREGDNEPQSPQRTLELRTGNSWDVSLLFAALVRSTGREVRLGLSSDRKNGLDISSPNGWVMANRRCIVVDFDGQPGFYTPGDALVPCGLLGTQDEGAMIHVCDRNKSHWVRAPIAKPAATQVHQTGKFHLDDKGTLAGEVEIELTGHRAREARDTYRTLSNDEALKRLRARLAERLWTAEPSELTWSNLEDNTQPFVLRYKVRVPAYGQGDGSRIALPLNFFTANTPAVFTSETRRYPICFDFAEQTVDDVELVLPEGFAIERGRGPANIGDPTSVVHAAYKTGYRPKSRTLSFHREQVIGTEGFIQLKAEAYPALREVFDLMRQSDVHQIALKAAPAATAQSAAPTEQR